MKIYLSPIRMDQQLSASVSGDTITVNDVALDFSPLQEGDVLRLNDNAVDSIWIAGDVGRRDGEIYLTLALPHGASAPHETRFPSYFSEPMTVVDGLVLLPPYDAPTAVDVQLPEQGVTP